VWHGRVTSISASWVVPRVATRSPGFASTWIGVETDAGHDRFLQIGVNEGHNADGSRAQLGLPRADHPAELVAFWSDTAHHFHPVYLGGGLKPGDVVHVSLRYTRGRWWLRIRDLRSALHLSFATSQERGPMMQAEWLQEDVINGATNRPFRYPRLSPITVGDLEVDGAPPTRSRLFAQRFAALQPPVSVGPIRGDTFTLRTRR
jgi:hypothetical protein